MIDVHNADVIATLLELKREVQVKIGHIINMTILGGSEAHLLAEEISKANVGVILNPVRPFPYNWDSRRMSVASTLITHY